MAGLVIQEIYGGSGSQNNATSTYNADYVVLHNTSSVAVDLTGYAIQVREGGGGANTAAWGVAALSGSVAAYGYFLIKLTGAGTGGATLSFDQDVSSVMTNPTLGITGRDVGATNGRIALTNTTDSLVTSDASSSPAIVDYAGWGNAISFEGAAETGAAGSRILSMYRDAAGGWDTNNNQADFSLHTPVPSNASSGALNAPPSFTSSATANFAENGTGTVLDAAAFDPEGATENGGGLTYSIVANAADDSALFSIDTDTGVLTFNSAPNFEAGSGHGTDLNHYVLNIRVTDNGGALAAQTDQAVIVTVTDVNDVAPVITTLATQDVAENTTIVAALTSTDADTVGTNPATFTVSGGTDAALFGVSGGNLVFLAARDFETQAHTYSVDVTADDGIHQTVKSITVNLTNVSPETLVGTAAADFLVGGTDSEMLFGFSGHDIMSGEAGADTLTGGRGRDLMFGGADSDVFDFNSRAETGRTAATRDHIFDFQHGFDHIDLSGIDANTHAGGNQSFRFIGGANFHHRAGELHTIRVNSANNAHDKTILEGDVNGDGRADFQIEIKGLMNLAGDVIL